MNRKAVSTTINVALAAACAATAAAQTAPDRTVPPIDDRTVERVNAVWWAAPR